MRKTQHWLIYAVDQDGNETLTTKFIGGLSGAETFASEERARLKAPMSRVRDPLGGLRFEVTARYATTTPKGR